MTWLLLISGDKKLERLLIGEKWLAEVKNWRDCWLVGEIVDWWEMRGFFLRGCWWNWPIFFFFLMRLLMKLTEKNVEVCQFWQSNIFSHSRLVVFSQPENLEFFLFLFFIVQPKSYRPSTYPRNHARCYEPVPQPDAMSLCYSVKCL